ncbi:hypothetical protein ACJX0J_015419, partial [Zea mays]
MLSTLMNMIFKQYEQCTIGILLLTEALDPGFQIFNFGPDVSFPPEPQASRLHLMLLQNTMGSINIALPLYQ